MANNRLFLYCPENNTVCHIAKAFGDGWFVPGNIDLEAALNAFFDDPDCDMESSYTGEATTLRLLCENDLPEGVKYINAPESSGTAPAK